MSRIFRASLLILSLSFVTVPVALAQTTTTGTTTSGGDTTTDTTTSGGDTTTTTTTGRSGGAASLGDEQALLEEGEAPPAARSGFEPGEVEGETYIFAGVLTRMLIIPSYPFDVGAVSSPDYSVPLNGAIGAYFNYRRNSFNVQLEVFYQGMGWEGFIRGNGDPITETEYIRSNLGVVFGYIGFGWAFDLTDWFAIEVGFGLGFGGVVGNLYRQEAVQAGSTGTWSPCTGPDITTGGYCEGPIETVGPEGRLDDSRNRGGTYQLSTGPGMPGTGPNPFYFGDGGVPPIFATIDLPRISFRIKPIHQIQIRIDTAFNLYGVSLGASVGYGF